MSLHLSLSPSLSLPPSLPLRLVGFTPQFKTLSNGKTKLFPLLLSFFFRWMSGGGTADASTHPPESKSSVVTVINRRSQTVSKSFDVFCFFVLSFILTSSWSGPTICVCVCVCSAALWGEHGGRSAAPSPPQEENCSKTEELSPDQV